MSYRSRRWISLVLFFSFSVGCATPSPAPDAPETPMASPAHPGGAVLSTSDIPGAATSEPVRAVVEKVAGDREKKAKQTKLAASTITIHCIVKLPDDPTDNPELCRSFQLVLVDEAGNESPRFRFGGDARYRFAGKAGKKYRIKPVIGKNWEYTVDPDRELVIGERANVQLKQKE